MGKHRNQTQNGIFLKFMEEHQDIARSYTKRDKVLIKSPWQELAQSLNSAGPPSKDVIGWKKIWTEWKSEIKKKLAHNKAESQATGSGPLNKFKLTQIEEAITTVQQSGFKFAVDGVSGIELSIVDDDAVLNDDISTQSSHKRSLESSFISNTPKRPRPESNAQLLKTLSKDGERKTELFHYILLLIVNLTL